MPAKITLIIKLQNSEGFEATDTVEDEYLTDPNSNELTAEVQQIAAGFRNMMQLLRTQGRAPQTTPPGRQKLRVLPFRRSRSKKKQR